MKKNQAQVLQHAAAIREKTKTMRDIYGGMMTVVDLAKELGYNSRGAARAWLSEAAVPGVRMGRSVRYETDLVARAIVDRRGMC